MDIWVEIDWLRDVILGKIEWRKCPSCAGKGVEYYNGETGEVWSNMQDNEWKVKEALGDNFYTETCENCKGLGFIEIPN